MRCSYCGGEKFFEGPAGGASMDVLCANPNCRHWFNLETVTGEMVDLKRVEQSEEERLAAEGFGLYHGGQPASACLLEEPYGDYAAANDAVLRLCGYIDAMRADHKRGK